MKRQKTVMIWSLVLGTCLFLVASCGTPTVPCGTFTFTGAPVSSGLSVTVTFDFDAASCSGVCSADCNCETVVYIQTARVYDMTTGNFLAPTTEYNNRMVLGRATTGLNGWMLDRLDGRVWGYYGRNNDGSFASTLTPGSNTTDAVLLDTPSGWPDESWLDFVTVPVCIDNAASCDDRLLGYYYWWFFIATGGSVSTWIDMNALEWHRDVVDEAVLEWNIDAPGLGKNVFPAMSPL